MGRPIYEIDGNNFNDFAGFIQEFNHGFVSRVGGRWNGNLDAFNDYLSWGDQRSVIYWKHSAKSKIDLGYKTMEEWLASILCSCHPSTQEAVQSQLKDAVTHLGPTLFDILVNIIRDNSDYVDLVLE